MIVNPGQLLSPELPYSADLISLACQRLALLVCLRACVLACFFSCVPHSVLLRNCACFLAYLLAFFLVCLLACILACVSVCMCECARVNACACLRACLLACLLACLCACVRDCVISRLLFYLHVCVRACLAILLAFLSKGSLAGTFPTPPTFRLLQPPGPSTRSSSSLPARMTCPWPSPPTPAPPSSLAPGREATGGRPQRHSLCLRRCGREGCRSIRKTNACRWGGGGGEGRVAFKFRAGGWMQVGRACMRGVRVRVGLVLVD
jgi:hypothetical protein